MSFKYVTFIEIFFTHRWRDSIFFFGNSIRRDLHGKFLTSELNWRRRTRILNITEFPNIKNLSHRSCKLNEGIDLDEKLRFLAILTYSIFFQPKPVIDTVKSESEIYGNNGDNLQPLKKVIISVMSVVSDVVNTLVDVSLFIKAWSLPIYTTVCNCLPHFSVVVKIGSALTLFLIILAQLLNQCITDIKRSNNQFNFSRHHKILSQQ